jgi:hypothetical protein
MIPVIPLPEPSHFQSRVRAPGRIFLRATPRPTARQWASHDYWTRVSNDLHAGYGQICAYSCHWIPCTDGRSVEHFRPKSRRPRLAYEWSNFRLVFGVLNGCKGNREDLLDPFVIQPGWFAIQFPSLLVIPGPLAPRRRLRQIRETIAAIHLNDDDKCLKDRLQYLRAYCVGQVNFHHLQHRAPFLAGELLRQNLVQAIVAMMRFPP